MTKEFKEKIIDISVPVKSDMTCWPGDPSVKIKLLKDMKKGARCNVSALSMGSHTGTHMDAPLHFIQGGKGLDKMPLSATVGPARVIKIKDKEIINVEELKKHKILKGERILFKTINSTYCWKSDEFEEKFVYIPQETAQYLARIGVRVVGVDYLSVGGFGKDGLETHQALLRAGIWIIEGLDLSRVIEGKYELICLPLKILNADGAPARAILRSL